MTSDITEVFGTVRADGDHRVLRMEHTYRTDPKDLWQALTDPARLRRWFARVEGDFRVDGTFCVFFDDTDPDQRTLGQVLECDAPHRLRVSWYFRDEGESHVAVDLSADGERTRFVLEHRRLPESAAAGYGAGWQAYVEALAVDVAGESEAACRPAWDQRWEELLPAYRAQLSTRENA